MTTNERDFILKKARRMLDHATGAHYCECVTDLGPASGFRKKKDPACQKCDWTGLISNPGWDGTREQFDILLTRSIVPGGQGGTAFVDPDDGVGPDKDCYWYESSRKGIRLTRGYKFNGTLTRDVVLSWPNIFKALTEPAQPEQLELV